MNLEIVSFAPGMPAPGGFLAANLTPDSPICRGQVPPNMPICRAALVQAQTQIDPNVLLQRCDDINRAADGDVSKLLSLLVKQNAELTRAISTQTPGFPVRENLEAEASIIFPQDTPVRNKLPRTTGSGTASKWKLTTSFGGGWTGVDQPGSAGAIRAFFAEHGAPAEHTTGYADRTGAYKYMGTLGSVSGQAMAEGANFQNQLSVEKSNSVRNLMLCEEYAITNADSTSTAAPWGDGVNALAYDGIIPSITTANGVPSNQVQSAIGALTTAFIDSMLRTLWTQGSIRPWILLSAQEAQSLVDLAQTSGTVIRVMASADTGRAVLGVTVTGYVHPISGEVIDIVASRFVPAGTMLFMATQLPDGKPAIDVQVLPQVQLPQLAPNQNVQGYVAQDLAPTIAAPQDFPFITTLYSVVRMKAMNMFGIGTGLTAV